jgi:hypothetical protein
MTTEKLLAEISITFPPIDMPKNADLRFHRDGCYHCDYLAKELEQYRGKSVSGPVIRILHQEMSCLSAMGWAWALPHYLPFCFTPEAEYNQMETEFLLYSLAPTKKFEAEARIQLSALSRRQVKCLVHFVEWLKGHQRWGTYCPSEIETALDFLNGIAT